MLNHCVRACAVLCQKQIADIKLPGVEKDVFNAEKSVPIELAGAPAVVPTGCRAPSSTFRISLGPRQRSFSTLWLFSTLLWKVDALTCLQNSLEPLGDMSLGFLQVCYDGNIFGSSVRQKGCVASVYTLVFLSFRFGRRAYTQLTRQFFTLRACKEGFLFREFVCQTFTW